LHHNDAVPDGSSPPIKVRPGVHDDIPALLSLVQSSYRGDASRAGWTTEADLLDGQRTDEQELDDLLTRPRSVVLVAERPAGAGPAELVACCHVERHEDGAAHLGLFAVRPDRQGDGIGRAVVAEAERWARDELGAREMQMFVIRQRDDLIAWYERLGYRRTGAFEPFPYGDERFGIPRRPDLEFAVIAKQLATDEPGGVQE
jgi:ribosomal protein S18 acetylase RimI-like enzyme